MDDEIAITFDAVVLQGKLVLTTMGEGFRRKVFVPVDRLSELELATSPLVIGGEVVEMAGGEPVASVTKVSVRWWASEEVITQVEYSYPLTEAEQVFAIITLALSQPGTLIAHRRNRVLYECAPTPFPSQPLPSPPAGMILADPDDGRYERRRDNFGNTWLTEYRIPKIGERYIDDGFPRTVLHQMFADQHVIVGGPL